MKCSNCYDAVAKMLDEKIKVIEAMTKTAEEANSRAVADHKEITALREAIKSMNTNQDTTLTNQDAFEKWWRIKNSITSPSWLKQDAYEAWQAATKASESEINSLKERVEELQADNLRLREYLVSASNYVHTKTVLRKLINNALSSTPTQSLAEHDNEVIERCAVVCESLKEQDYCVDVRAGAEAIRALKVTP